MGNWIEEKLYKIILDKMSIPTVDAIVIHKDKFLLLKRNNPPVKGMWWFPGGRVRRGESLEQAVKREVLEETGLECKILRRVGVINQIFPEVHAVSVYYLVESKSPDVKLNSEHSAYKWFLNLPENSHNYLKTMIKKAGITS